MIYRLFDIILLTILTPVITPIFIVISIFLYFKIKRPIFFIQKRSGYNGKEFRLYKFRTMAILKVNQDIEKSDEKLYAINEKKRVLTAIKFLRKTRLDEIPQLLNVLKNDISFVGPRPLLMEYNLLYDKEQKKRLSVMPGITGWSQIYSDTKITWKKKFELDVWYVQNKSLYINLKIILLTIKYFVKKLFDKNDDEIYLHEKFNGNN
ncbi:sugar transferase [Candidatus Pelagibacter sp.]|jgi:lipopolysaccharide/colanic/teichoic acid biosynthesis glycosyltransferase|nr:sugar transferase [Candidatus Pelagibacter sp.]|tara:strand:- start:804 stop:1424 length:621 start_codon:yes stop_codon:yes gene_type:complete